MEHLVVEEQDVSLAAVIDRAAQSGGTVTVTRAGKAVAEVWALRKQGPKRRMTEADRAKLDALRESQRPALPDAFAGDAGPADVAWLKARRAGRGDPGGEDAGAFVSRMRDEYAG